VPVDTKTARTRGKRPKASHSVLFWCHLTVSVTRTSNQPGSVPKAAHHPRLLLQTTLRRATNATLTLRRDSSARVPER
jgi:hypothetical protein